MTEVGWEAESATGLTWVCGCTSRFFVGWLITFNVLVAGGPRNDDVVLGDVEFAVDCT